MICPKCGRNIEGNICPYCDEPQIDDNTEEYLRRKNAYEESLAREDEPEEEAKPPARRFKRKHGIAILAVIGAALAVALFTTHLPKVYHGRLFTEKEGVVYEISGNGEPVPKEGRIYSSEGKSVYAEVREPEELSLARGAQLKGYSASKNGEHFALATLEGTDGEESYGLYLWNRNGTEAKALSTKDVVSVKDVTDSGEVIYTTSPVLNDQWYMGDSSLNVTFQANRDSGGEIAGERTRLSDKLRSFFVYEQARSIICLDESGQLNSFPGYKPEDRRDISAGVSVVLAEKPDQDNYFSRDTTGVNAASSADLIAYLSEGIWRMTDTQGRVTLTLGAAGEDAEFIYDNSDRVVYKKEGAQLSRSIVTEAGLRGWELIGEAAGSMVWDADKNTLIYEDADGALRRVRSSENTLIAENVKAGSLKKIQNGGGYLFEGADGLYISRDFRGAPARLSGEIAGEIENIAEYKGAVYVHAGGRLYAIDKGNNVRDMDACDGLHVVG